MTVEEVLREYREIRERLRALPAGTAVPPEDIRELALLSREAHTLWQDRTRPYSERCQLNGFRAWLVSNGLPDWTPPSTHVLHRQDVIRMMRDAKDSGADLWMHLANEFGIEDEELKRSFRYVIHEDVVAAATRASRHLIAKPRGAIGREVRADIQLVLETIANGEGEVIE